VRREKLCFPSGRRARAVVSRHVHVFVADQQAVIELAPVRVSRLSRKMKVKDVVIAVRLVEENLKLLKAEWRRIHG
jgi:hypothetical protein